VIESRLCPWQSSRADTIKAPVTSPLPMRNARRVAWTSAAALVACLVLPAVSTAAVPPPNFDAVKQWNGLGCDTPDLITQDNPRSASFAGDHANLPAYYAYDTDYLYFRYRMDENPASGGDFDQYVWTALMQVPSGNRFQYQYQLSLNGNGKPNDSIEIWKNRT